MSTRNLAVVGLRLLAIYCFVESIVQSTSLFTLYSAMTIVPRAGVSRATEGIAFGLALLPGVSLLLLAALLFVFSGPVARRLAPGGSEGPEAMVCTFEELQAMAFAVAGILILATALPLLAQYGAAVVSSHRERGEIPGQYWLRFIGAAARVVAGLVLLLNANACRNVWNRLRTAGT